VIGIVSSWCARGAAGVAPPRLVLPLLVGGADGADHEGQRQRQRLDLLGSVERVEIDDPALGSA